MRYTLYLVILGTVVITPNLPSAPPKGYKVVKTTTGVASAYWPGDRFTRKKKAMCADGKEYTPGRCHIAHRTWRFGSRVRVCSFKTRKCAVSFIGDRGPWGACDGGVNPRTYACRGKWRIKIRRKDPGIWRGIADLSKCVADRIGHKGLNKVRLELLAPAKEKTVTWKRTRSEDASHACLTTASP